MNRLSHQADDQGVLIVLRHQIGAPASIRVTEEEAIRFARAVLDDLDPEGNASGLDRIKVGRLEISPAEQIVLIDGQRLHLTPLQFRFLSILARRPGVVVSKDQFMRALYDGKDEAEVKIVDVLACKLRDILGTQGARRQIETVWGRGYRLVDAPRNDARPGHIAKPAPVQLAIIDALRAYGSMDLPWLQAAVPQTFGKSSVDTALRTLVARGIVSRSGEMRAYTYSLAEAKAA